MASNSYIDESEHARVMANRYVINKEENPSQRTKVARKAKKSRNYRRANNGRDSSRPNNSNRVGRISYRTYKK